MKTKLYLILVAMFIMASPIFAQTGGAGLERKSTDIVALAAGFSMAIAAAGCALGMGKAIGSATEGMARNPGASGAIRAALILGLVFIESLALYVIMIIFTQVHP